MKTEAEVKEAIGHLEHALQSRTAAADPIATALMYSIVDAFKWVLADPTSRFEIQVIEPCRAVDRARKAKNN